VQVPIKEATMTPSPGDEIPPSDEPPEMVRVCTKHVLENGDVLRMMRLVPVLRRVAPEPEPASMPESASRGLEEKKQADHDSENR